METFQPRQLPSHALDTGWPVVPSGFLSRFQKLVLQSFAGLLDTSWRRQLLCTTPSPGCSDPLIHPISERQRMNAGCIEWLAPLALFDFPARLRQASGRICSELQNPEVEG